MLAGMVSFFLVILVRFNCALNSFLITDSSNRLELTTEGPEPCHEFLHWFVDASIFIN